VKLEVWAPSARSVELVTQDRRVALHPADPQSTHAAGYWQAEVEASLLTDGYRYSLDGAAPLPDPRSRWQPAGVHGSSHVVQLPPISAQFRAAPLSEAVIYELHIGTFTSAGTYAAAQAKLPHLVDLGVTHVELMPLATFPGERGWGYDGVYLNAPFPAYGTPLELAAFVQACHARGIAVLLDVVYNHLGPDGNYLAQYAPYFTDRYKTGWGAAINYDGPHSDPVRRLVIDNALMWLRSSRHIQFRRRARARGTGSRRETAGRDARPQLHRDRRERLERSALGAAGAPRRPRNGRTLGG
jgi:maltooligosyltrehalose trehalohydrolase